MLTIAEETAFDNLEKLGEDQRPGQGIVIGLNTLGDMALQVFWLAGRDRELFDHGVPVESLSLGRHITANGNHINGIIAGIRAGYSFASAFREGVEALGKPRALPRIASMLTTRDGTGKPTTPSYQFSISRRGSPTRIYRADRFSDADRGLGYCVNTYIDEDLLPLPSFSLPSFRPYSYDVLPVGEGPEDTAEIYRDGLSPAATTLVMVRGVNLETNYTLEHMLADETWLER